MDASCSIVKWLTHLPGLGGPQFMAMFRQRMLTVRYERQAAEKQTSSVPMHLRLARAPAVVPRTGFRRPDPFDEAMD
jgi:hypothetical protein